MPLSNEQYKEFQKALMTAYNKNSLTRMLRFELDMKLDHIAGGGSFADTVYTVIDSAEMEGWTDDLIKAAYETNPRNPKLKAFAEQFLKYRVTTQEKGALEKIVDASNRFIDMSDWLSRLSEIERQVCSVEIGLQHSGTGFLIGPNLVMTNYHVISKVLAGKRGLKPADVTLRFDYKQSKDGKVANEGTRVKVAEQWLVDHSKFSEIDREREPKSADPQPDLLDYAILRLAEPIGKASIGADSEAIRGWMAWPSWEYDFPAQSSLFIVQHPLGMPLKLALDTDGVIGLNGNQTRVKYRTNTEPGSSGSPCFNADLELVALHHSGDPNSELPAFNEGIPMVAIGRLLAERKLTDTVGLDAKWAKSTDMSASDTACD